MSDRTVRTISQRLSLRQPQVDSLEILADVLAKVELTKGGDPAAALAAIREFYPTIKDFERDFPSLCFALATGLGKTRLMGAFISYLYLTGKSRHFFVLAPNTTIYEKLINDFSPESPKYVFKGIAEFAANPALIVTGDSYESGIGVRYESGRSTTLFDSDVHINIFNVDKINKEEGPRGTPRMKRLQETIGESYYEYLSKLNDLVLLMDEAHRYRASAGANAIDGLKPILGLELTATAKTVGARSVPFKNVIYNYTLGQAMADGLVKEPAVATRKDFDPKSVSPAELERIKLQDAVHYHDHVAVELDRYHRTTGAPKVTPFLTDLQSVKWQIGADSPGEVSRHKHSEFHFEVLKRTDGRATSSSHFLKFDQAVPGLEKQRVAVAFPWDLLPGVPQFQQGKPLSEQMKIIPAEPGHVAVFFPAVNETSGLRFHLHGPFVPAMSRSGIKETEANTPLYEQIAALAARTLHRIKELGFLNTEFLSALPNPQDQIPPRYKGIRAAIIAEMKSQPLTPTYEREHAPASRLIQAKASLKSLLSENDIGFLVDYNDAPPLWAVGATQRNNRIDNFLDGLDIRDWGLGEFVKTLQERTSTESRFIRITPHWVNEPDAEFLSWLKQKPQAWMQEFYALLNDELSGISGLKPLCIVRLADGTLSRADRVFFAAESTSDDIPVADRAVYTSGTSKRQQDSAKSFLSQIGAREIGRAEEVEIILKRRYTKEAELPDDATYLDDLKRFIALTEEKPDAAKLFAQYRIFQGKDEQWYTPGGICLDSPYMDTGLSAYYDRLGGDAKTVSPS